MFLKSILFCVNGTTKTSSSSFVASRCFFCRFLAIRGDLEAIFVLELPRVKIQNETCFLVASLL